MLEGCVAVQGTLTPNFLEWQICINESVTLAAHIWQAIFHRQCTLTKPIHIGSLEIMSSGSTPRPFIASAVIKLTCRCPLKLHNIVGSALEQNCAPQPQSAHMLHCTLVGPIPSSVLQLELRLLSLSPQLLSQGGLLCSRQPGELRHQLLDTQRSCTPPQCVTTLPHSSGHVSLHQSEVAGACQQGMPLPTYAYAVYCNVNTALLILCESLYWVSVQGWCWAHFLCQVGRLHLDRAWVPVGSCRAGAAETGQLAAPSLAAHRWSPCLLHIPLRGCLHTRVPLTLAPTASAGLFQGDSR